MRFGKGLNKDSFNGRNKGGAMGPGGYCICMKCGYKTPHTKGMKCTKIKCPECGHIMVRQELVASKKKK